MSKIDEHRHLEEHNLQWVRNTLGDPFKKKNLLFHLLTVGGIHKDKYVASLVAQKLTERCHQTHKEYQIRVGAAKKEYHRLINEIQQEFNQYLSDHNLSTIQIFYHRGFIHGTIVGEQTLWLSTQKAMFLRWFLHSKALGTIYRRFAPYRLL